MMLSFCANRQSPQMVWFEVQGKPVCVALSQHSRKQPFLSSGILDHVLGIESLESAGLGLLTVVNISLDTGAGLQKIMQWLNANG